VAQGIVGLPDLLDRSLRAKSDTARILDPLLRIAVGALLRSALHAFAAGSATTRRPIHDLGTGAPRARTAEPIASLRRRRSRPRPDTLPPCVAPRRGFHHG
jgi:hypothetical protein